VKTCVELVEIQILRGLVIDRVPDTFGFRAHIGTRNDHVAGLCDVDELSVEWGDKHRQ